MEISCFQYSSPNCSPEQDDDMAANCLILLAQGGGSHQSTIKTAARKFSDMAAVGAYVYECKTCTRTFSSFQALGGHRASHKKPKLVTDHHHDHPAPAPAVKKEIPPSITPAQASPEKAPKIHECSICGAEFSSGQALGGHMRRHRPVAATSAAPREIGAESSVNHDSAGPRGGLDLNLPAPQEEEDEEGDSSNNNNNANNKFEFSGKQQSLVFSAPPLVDCHY